MDKIFNNDLYMKVVFTVIVVALCAIAIKMIYGISINGSVTVYSGGYLDVNVLN